MFIKFQGTKPPTGAVKNKITSKARPVGVTTRRSARPPRRRADATVTRVLVILFFPTYCAILLAFGAEGLRL